MCLRTFTWPVSVSLGLTFCFALLKISIGNPGFPAPFYTKGSCYTPPTGLEILLPLQRTSWNRPFHWPYLFLSLLSVQLWHGWRIENDTESECRELWDLQFQPFHFSDRKIEAQGKETTKSRSQKELMSDLGLDLRILNSQYSVFALAEFIVDHSWKISCLKW